MHRPHPIAALSRKSPLLASLLDDLLHPTRKPVQNDDPGRPFTPPPSEPSKEEKEDDDDDGPNFPMDPALA